MSAGRTASDIEGRAALFKALGHPSRLIILNLLGAAPRHTEELATILELTPATVSHHLSQLARVGLIEGERQQYYQVYSRVDAILDRKLSELVRFSLPGLRTPVDEDAFRRKVLETFFRRGQLTNIPAQRKKRDIVLERLVEEFVPDRDYPEREVNRILGDFHEDFATLRRELVGAGLMTRKASVYRRA